ncbi:hypothetical protein BJ875DRAFT_244957 [Amylocarpus encephaloides]|uniref:RNAse P Rpr2/Rpp21/SNM1 subunit domain-containing protein n=1 Tax=Amylocarpus encephaloides TaxID=45428 RepID=A0A9P8CA68_9HELO|nr:hypothetical protein BJ875DRAFT_244957 [Amylocarpus encephaloides]
MASQDISARLRYLNDSAHLLAVTAPSTSKHIMSSYNSLLSDNHLDSTEEHKREVCGACGAIMALGWEAIEEFKDPRRKRERNNVTSTKTLTYRCLCCKRRSNHTVTSCPRHKPKKLSPSFSRPIIATTTTTTETMHNLPSKEASSTNGKKRSKSKKQSGLQALLAKQKASQNVSSGFGLDLLDFMK